MANILPPESSAEIGAREVEGESDFEHVMKCKGRVKGKIEKGNEGEEKRKGSDQVHTDRRYITAGCRASLSL